MDHDDVADIEVVRLILEGARTDIVFELAVIPAHVLERADSTFRENVGMSVSICELARQAASRP